MSLVYVYMNVCCVFVRVCLYVLCGHLLGKAWPLGSRLWCLTVSLSLSHWYPGSGVVLDCIDSWSLYPYSWPSFVVSNCEFATFQLVSWVRCGTWLYRFLIFVPLLAMTISGNFKHFGEIPGRVAQSVTCLVTDAKLTADPGVASSIPARSHTFVEIDHEIISTVILLPSAESFMRGCCQIQAKVCAQLLVNCLFKLAQEKSVVRSHNDHSCWLGT